MQQSATFQVYNASAGSGKTFTLVKEYLKILLSTENIFAFQKILAITFTNKAAGEMKERVLTSLEAFSEGKETDLLQQILREIPVDKEIIRVRSQKILDAILQNYSAFSITTIDSFTHKIIKNFAYDLGLSLNFEVEMDAQSLLNEAVDVLISKIGTDKKLTEILIDYSLDKTDDDTSWDITKELNDFSKILLNEDDIKHFKNLKNKTLDDFFDLKKRLQKSKILIENQFIEFADEVLSFIKAKNLLDNDFSYSDYPNHFKKLKNLNFENLNFEGRLHKSIESSKDLYSAKTSKTSKLVLDENKEQFQKYYYQSKELFERLFPDYNVNKLVLKSIIPLAVLNHINSELETIKNQNNIRLNAEFNLLISDQLKEQPAPFIYERIGQRFQNYFIDEMQDTSELQWQNLIPLIDNVLSQENGSLLLVGDGKQAIYRWRGGKAAQFINLGSAPENPFQTQKSLHILETNYRSFAEIINFNNSFFTHLSNFLANESYQKLFFEGNNQLENSKKGGFVSITFIDKEEEVDEVESENETQKTAYPKKVFDKIIDIQQQFSLHEICVLTRTKKDGIAIANYLQEHEIPIISSETLLLKNNQKVIFIVNFLQLMHHPEDEETRFEMLYFLHEHLQIPTTKHEFFERFIKFENQQLFKKLKEFEIYFDETNFQQLPLYEKVEEIIRSFHLVTSSDAYVQFFLDVVLEQQNKGSDISDFVDCWEIKKETLSIVAPESANAVQIMTIHKAKGLEFPVVIFPCDVDIYQQIKPKVWLDELPKNYEPFTELLVDFKKDLQLISDRGIAIYKQQREELELDNFNLLYVALTRAVEQLHIITGNKLPKKEKENPTFFSEFFKIFLKENNYWDESVFEYNFGNNIRVSITKNVEVISEVHEKFISIPWKEQNLVLLASASKLWDTTQGKAIEFGNLIHEMLAQIFTFHDIEKVVKSYFNEGYISSDELKIIEKIIQNIVFHPTLKTYFSEDVIVFNEREIVDDEQKIIIPDRLIFVNDEVVIIDYKTGNQLVSHQQQLFKYQKVLEKMNCKVREKLLIYIGETIDVVKV
ncbi:UvrD-helicase domain-containing protein [Polaribacter gangjinensis]|uniref:DNA 3'-5' helicase n=1 Tax=Polaribacter gangjinensis TaxID=574710 RepID=A0A2S7WDR8_9FLAO|nr:UvrD-helicase domain-containing protein [Polaribacter gangjinensis]PQJ75764.1 DNA helicase UvrD [Polaribacter gangjinensis]